MHEFQVAPIEATILKALHAQSHKLGELSLHAELPSTSQWLKEQISQHPEHVDKAPWLCATNWQTNGSGRRGKQWDSEPGNITFSIMTKAASPPGSLMGLSLVTGLAVAKVLESLFDLNVQLKWPNDIMCDGAKLGGLLTEVQTVPENNSESLVFTGIGLNVLHHPQQSALGIGATSLQNLGLHDVDRDSLLGELAASVLTFHQKFLLEGWASFAESWQSHDFLSGQHVTLHRNDEVERVLACGVNEEGALVVTASGRSFPVYSGEVSVRPT